MTAEQFFIEEFNKCTWIEDDERSGNIFMLFDKHHERKMKMSSILNNGKGIQFVKTEDTVVLFYQDHKNGYFECNYSKIWTVFSDKYGLKYQEINELIKGILNNDTKLKVLTPPSSYYQKAHKLNNDTKLKVLTPRKLN